MLQITDIKRENVVVTVASGKLNQHDLEKIHPLIHSILEKGLKIRWYLEMNDFQGWHIEGLWEDFTKDVDHEKEYEKIALVGEKKWQSWAVWFMSPFSNAHIKYFTLNQKKEAEKWIESD
ncbi:STAS/SEC14 domain-containing protein [Zunongwangia sp. F363]|uniref:STAS/SEC14 domain-containing protein n=1 Tax=Autumnicola tepida TaxID=3075595 RepID=A0ABU3C894_9FLAO|nr:STAS/SEC14 domain-containing protein [Zunongwangia sp. F363]MDT0642547.1 STAS/SEC14 domain-containing protein [Zunongwangia sp. F363]